MEDKRLANCQPTKKPINNCKRGVKLQCVLNNLKVRDNCINFSRKPDRLPKISQAGCFTLRIPKFFYLLFFIKFILPVYAKQTDYSDAGLFSYVLSNHRLFGA